MPRVKLVIDEVVSINLKDRKVGTASSGSFDFDYIIIALGSVTDYSTIPGLRESNMDFHTSAEGAAKIYAKLKSIKSGNIVVGIAGLPYKCPPSPNEAAFMLHDYLKEHKVGGVSLTYITPYTRFYPAEAIDKEVAPLAEARGIKVNTVFNLDHVDSAAKRLVSLEGNEVPFDYLFLVPPHKTPEVLRGMDFVDKDGWIKVDKSKLTIEGYGNAYAIGDVTNAPGAKTGVTVHLEAKAIAGNIANEIQGKSARYIYTGRTNCPFEVGEHKATFVVGTYTTPVKDIKPSFENYILKQMMAKFYWGSVKGTYDDIFKRYFGEDYLKQA
ncbi:FAD-dependent pyridine nucleotide-disulfide oxidoreductase [mine drainage metagenome]|uniref:FAD-dependent pyridine nucleotide-disulfide oxidoreductase n=1 Tax=mine drainage metagenome TaxID=410659 RepID=T1CL32_9ZZZZ